MRHPAGAQARPARGDRRGRPQGHRAALARQARQGRGEHRRSGRGRGPRARDRPDDAVRALDHADLRAQALRHLVLPGRGAGGPDRAARRLGVRQLGVDRRRRRRSTRRRPAGAPWCMPRPRTSNCWPRPGPCRARCRRPASARSSRSSRGSSSATASVSCIFRKARAIVIWSARCRRSRFRRPGGSSGLPRPGRRAKSG